MSDLMREEFEIAISEMLTRDTGSEVTRFDMIDLRKGDEYKAHSLSSAWWAWQTSREMLVIELPEVLDTTLIDFDVYSAESIEDAINAAGVKTK